MCAAVAVVGAEGDFPDVAFAARGGAILFADAPFAAVAVVALPAFAADVALAVVFQPVVSAPVVVFQLAAFVSAAVAFVAGAAFVAPLPDCHVVPFPAVPVVHFVFAPVVPFAAAPLRFSERFVFQSFPAFADALRFLFLPAGVAVVLPCHYLPFQKHLDSVLFAVVGGLSPAVRFFQVCYYCC